MNDYKPTVLDLFCGVGGMSYGFSMAGFKPVLGIDNDKSARQTYIQNHENTKFECLDLSDKKIVQKVGGLISGPVDVIIGGPPCQGLSLAGPRRFDDPRNKLFLGFVRLTAHFKPKAFVLENVPGLASLFGGKIKDVIISSFSKLGYKVKFQVLNAADYGVPQLRKRIVFVGVRKDLGDFEFPKPDLAKHITAEDAISDLPRPANDNEEIISYDDSPANAYQAAMRNGIPNIQNHVITVHTPKVIKIISMVPEGGNYKNLPPKYRKTRNFHVAWTRYHSKKPASTIDTGHRHHFHYRENRVPTVRENARFQSFPDKFIFLGNKTQQYRHVGNAVPPLLAKAVASQLMKVLK
jgi:DNA (cytosine-5)-methyltransferase 1